MGPKYLIVFKDGSVIDPHRIRNIERKTIELRELCDSRSDEWVRKEFERREANSKKRHEEYEKKMESWFTESDKL
tara:strand:+ start:758 stop:982 length:225 start_codon:yes stop_codon:yes gene_type:complete